MKYEIGSRIRCYRERCGYTQKEFAEMLGVSNSRISNWELGINRPDADILASICRVLQVSPSVLLDVRLTADELTEQEYAVLAAYRDKPHLQQAVRVLLGVEELS